MIADLSKKRRPVLIIKHGRPAAYLVDVETFTGLNRRLAIGRNRARRTRVARRSRDLPYGSQETNGSMAELIWTEPALHDLEAIADYISIDSPAAACQLVRRVFSHVEQLSEHPKSGSIPKELRGLKYRQIVQPPCRIFYRIVKNRVVIPHVMRGEMRLRKRISRQREKGKH